MFKSEFFGWVELLASKAFILFLILVFIAEVSSTNCDSCFDVCFHCFSLILTKEVSCNSLITSMFLLIALTEAEISSIYHHVLMLNYSIFFFEGVPLLNNHPQQRYLFEQQRILYFLCPFRTRTLHGYLSYNVLDHQVFLQGQRHPCYIILSVGLASII